MSALNDSIIETIIKTKKPYHPDFPPDYKAIRKDEIERNSVNPLPRGVHVTAKTHGNIRILYTEKRLNPTDESILYIHGGGFVMGSPESRTAFTGYAASKLGINVASPDYRLAPEHPFPAAPEDCLEAYRILLHTYRPEKITVIGESAGGNLVLVLLLMIKAAGLPMPGMTVSVSPCVQFDRELASYTENEATEAMVTNLADEVSDMYIGSRDESRLKNPLVAPLYGDFTGVSPVYLFVSDSELLRDDSYLMFEKLKKDGVETKLFIRKGMIHAWITIPFIPESKKDIRIIEKLISQKDAFDGKDVIRLN